MKTKWIAGLIVACASCGLWACHDDDTEIDVSNIPADVEATFDEMFPGAKWVDWELESPYYVADFTYNTYETEAWFTANGIWAMTEIDYNANIYSLPQNMQETFLASQYANWMVDDVALYQRPTDTFCAIDVETNSGSQEVTIYIGSDGTVLNVTPDYDQVILPGTIISSL